MTSPSRDEESCLASLINSITVAANLPMSSSEHPAQGVGAGAFRTTHWSVVLAASHRLLDKHYLEGITREGGRFRSYLLTTLKHFLANEWERARTQKRGGGKALVSLDDQDAESRYKFEPADRGTPEILFERRWALTVLDQVMVRLREEYITQGKAVLFEHLQPLLAGDKSLIPCAEVGAALSMSEGAVIVAVHRLRKRYGQLLRDEIAETAATSEEVEDEIRYLISAASR